MAKERLSQGPEFKERNFSGGIHQQVDQLKPN